MALLQFTPDARADAAIHTQDDDAVHILAFGDSLVHGYGLPDRETFPVRLEQALRERGYEATVVNAGNSGDTTEAGKGRLGWVLDDDIDAAIVVLGANDALRGIDPASTRENLDAILTMLREADVPALLAGMKAPRNLGAEYVEAFDTLYPELAETHGAVFMPFFLEDVAADRDLNQGDGIHPNAEGVAVIVDNILPKVEDLIERARADDAAAG